MNDSYEYKPPLGFDISVKASKGKKKKQDSAHRNCEWSGCDKPAPHRAPRTPGQLDDYRWFCQSHAQQYNRSWNFFEDMSEEEMAEYQAATITGDRPTWGMGTNAWAHKGKDGPATGFEPGKSRPRDRTGGLGKDPFDLMGEDDRRRAREERHIPKLQKQALKTLHLDETACMEDVKQRYKELVKRFHPDANGGDRGAEDRLREVINAYRTLRAANFR